MHRNRILLVEDDPALGFVIKDNLDLKGYDVTWCRDGADACLRFTQSPPDLCILDIMLPKKDGFTLAREIRAVSRQVPVLFLTARSLPEDRLEGFRTGADDYICKPFSMEELVYRIEVFLRRSRIAPDDHDNAITIGRYRFDKVNLTLHHASGRKTLTSKEAALLTLLWRNRARILKREEILTQVWGDDDYFMGRSMDVFISKLRKYLKDDPSVQIINYHGIGFRLEEK